MGRSAYSREHKMRGEQVKEFEGLSIAWSH
jgi:hypothetical protein